MIAIQLHERTAHARAEALLRAGILVKDTHGHTLRVLPPLVIAEADLDAALEVIVGIVGSPTVP